MKTWKPDTCECVVEEIYSGKTVVGGGSVIKKCAAHATVADSELYGVLYSNPDGENKVKNLIEKKLLEDDSLGVSESFTNEEGQEQRRYKHGIKYEWHFEGTGKDRILHFGTKGATLSKPQKDKLKDYADTTFGTQKKRVEVI